MGLFNGNFGNGDFLLTMLEFFLFVIWFWLLLAIFADLFRDRDASGWAKALWVVFVVVLPYVGVFVYLIARGRGMAARSQEQAQAAQDSLDARIRSASGTSTSPSDQITQAKGLLDSGAISQSEFDALKGKALAV
jgi:hypothetical protein